MAIKVNGTTVINDSRQLQNVASIDATTVAALGAAGVGGANISETAILNPSLNTWDARQVPESNWNYNYSFTGLPPSGTYATIKTFTGSALVAVTGELNTTSTSDSTFMSNYSTFPGEGAYAGYQMLVYFYDASQNITQQVLFGESTDGRAQAFFDTNSSSKSSAIRTNWPRLNMGLRVVANGDKILLSISNASYWGGFFTLNANVLKFKFVEVN
jgi:hypothetical protein